MFSRGITSEGEPKNIVFSESLCYTEPNLAFWGIVGIGRRAWLRIMCRKACGFDSHIPHLVLYQSLKLSAVSALFCCRITPPQTWLVIFFDWVYGWAYCATTWAALARIISHSSGESITCTPAPQLRIQLPAASIVSKVILTNVERPIYLPTILSKMKRLPGRNFPLRAARLKSTWMDGPWLNTMMPSSERAARGNPD